MASPPLQSLGTEQCSPGGARLCHWPLWQVPSTLCHLLHPYRDSDSTFCWKEHQFYRWNLQGCQAFCLLRQPQNLQGINEKSVRTAQIPLCLGLRLSLRVRQSFTEISSVISGSVAEFCSVWNIWMKSHATAFQHCLGWIRKELGRMANPGAAGTVWAGLAQQGHCHSCHATRVPAKLSVLKSPSSLCLNQNSPWIWSPKPKGTRPWSWESFLFSSTDESGKAEGFPGITVSVESCSWILWRSGEGPQGCTLPISPCGTQSKQLWKLSEQEKGGTQNDLQAVNHHLLFDILCLFVSCCSVLRAEQEHRRWKLHQRGTHCHGLSWLRLNDLEYTIQITAKS